MNKLRAGIIGLGVGEQHIHGYRQHPACEVVMLCDFSPEKAASVSPKYPDIAFTPNAEEVLTNPEIDVVSIASYDNFHYEQIVMALEHNKHVFVEKPFVLYREHAEHIQSLLRERPHLKLSSNLIMRRYPRFLAVKEMIEQGKLGRLYYVEADYQYGRLHKITQDWRGQLDFYSVIYGGGVHVVDLLLWLTQDRVVEVSAYGNQIAAEGTSFRFNDMVVGILQFESGLIGKVSANFGCVHPHFHAVNLFGTEATFMNGLDEGRLFTSRDPQILPQPMTQPYPGTHKGELIANFIEGILTSAPLLVGQTDVMNSMAVCFALEEAVTRQQKVQVAYF
jgi:predicted dehydrogenase